MIRNLPLTLGELVNATAKAIAAQQQSLDLLAKTVLDNCIANDYSLSEQGGIYTIADITFCMWINASGEVEIQLQDRGTSTLATTSFTWFSMVLSFVQLAYLQV